MARGSTGAASSRSPGPPSAAIPPRSRLNELPFGLHSRDEAVNYFAWQARCFRAHVHGHVLDHGAGTGALSARLLELPLERLTVLEPEPVLSELLRERFESCPKADVYIGTLEAYRRQHAGAALDCIVSSNVIEHIDDDVACLRTMFELLRPGGRACLYVPARPELYGTLDEEVGHFRRYTTSDLRTKLERAGFVVERLAYRNLVATLPWFVTGRVLGRRRIEKGGVQLFDRWVFPVTRWLEDAVEPPYGLNVVAVGAKPAR